MNDEQRAVLAAVGRMEQRGGTLIDEYTVAREAGVIRGELATQEYAHSQERAQIRQLLEDLERGGMLRLSREGYWRPRTTLAGRRAWQDPQASLLPSAVVAASPPPAGRPGAAQIPDIFGDDDELPPEPRWASQRPAPEREPAREEQPARAWPAWWPAALRFGDPGLTPLVSAAAAGLLALVLIFVVGSRIVSNNRATPTPTVAVVAQTATAFAALPSPTPPTAGGGAQPSASNGAGAGTPGARPTTSAPPAPTQPRLPTATSGPPSAKVRIANTELQGAWLFATPAGERTTIGVPEGTLVEIAGPDQRDTQGRNWKQIYWANDVFWLLEEYTTPAE